MSKKKYIRIIFLENDNAREALNILENSGKIAAIDFLAQWDYGDRAEIYDKPSHGTNDRVLEHNEYLLSYNLGLGYIGLERVE